MKIERDIMECKDMYKFYMELRNSYKEKRKEIAYVFVAQERNKK